MTNWYTVPTAPRRLMGDISAKYIGAKPAFRPELMPIKNRPRMTSSYDDADFADASAMTAKITRMLLRSRPPFLPKLSATIPKMQKRISETCLICKLKLEKNQIGGTNMANIIRFMKRFL